MHLIEILSFTRYVAIFAFFTLELLCIEIGFLFFCTCNFRQIFSILFCYNTCDIAFQIHWKCKLSIWIYRMEMQRKLIQNCLNFVTFKSKKRVLSWFSKHSRTESLYFPTISVWFSPHSSWYNWLMSKTKGRLKWKQKNDENELFLNPGNIRFKTVAFEIIR